MKQTTAIATFILATVLGGSPLEANKPWPRLKFEQIQGEWIGQCALGDVFRLNLESATSGSLGYVTPQWEDEVTAHAIGDIQFDGVTITISVTDREYGDFVLVGFARENFMDLTIKGLYTRSKPQIRFLRPHTWTGSLDRLRSGMAP